MGFRSQRILQNWEAQQTFGERAKRILVEGRG